MVVHHIGMDVARVKRIVIVLAETQQSVLIVDVKSERIDRGQSDVNADVKLSFAHQERLVNVLLHKRS